jgi:hypothetical protein
LLPSEQEEEKSDFFEPEDASPLRKSRPSEYQIDEKDIEMVSL